METLTKTIQPRTTDTLRQALSTLAALMDRTINEVNVLDSEIQEGVRHAVHEVQESMHKEASERQQLAVEEAIEKTRASISEEFFQEMQRLSDETAQANAMFAAAQKEHLQALADTEEAAAMALERQVARSVERVRVELTSENDTLRSELERTTQQLAESKSEFHRVASEKESALKEVADKLRLELEKAIASGERTKYLLAEAQATNAQIALDAKEAAESAASAHLRDLASATEKVRAELSGERERIGRQLDELLHSAAQWEIEREQLQAEIKGMNAALETAKTAAKQEVAATNSFAVESIHSEIRRVEESIKTISTVIDAPETELSVVIRKNVERAELEAYLKGIRFVVSGK